MNLSTEPGGVRGIPSRAIHERQLDDDMLLLQRAASASHQRGQFLEAVRVTAAVLLAAAGVLITLVGHGRTAVSIVGFFWFVVSAFLLKGLAGNTARQGALLQEMFDVALFHLPWRSTVAGDPIPEPDVRRLARKLPEVVRRTSASLTVGTTPPTRSITPTTFSSPRNRTLPGTPASAAATATSSPPS